MAWFDRFRKLAYFALFVILLPISAYICYGALDTLNYADAVEAALPGKWGFLFLLLLAAVFFVLCVGLCRALVPRLERCGPRAEAAIFALMICLQVLLVLTVKTSLRYDHLRVFDIGLALFDKETIADTHFGSYLMKSPNNVFLCIFTHLFMKLAVFFGVPEGSLMDFMKLVNVAFMNIGLWCAYSLLVRHRSRRTGLTLLLLVLVNPLWYLLGEMYYTSTISLAFSMGAIWLFDRARGTDRPQSRYALYFLSGGLLILGYEVRATVIITLCALLIYAFLEKNTMKFSRKAAGLAVFLLGAAAAFGGYKKLEARYAGFNPSETTYPIVYWVMMSAQGEGQYNSADDGYIGSFDTQEEQQEAAVALLKERLADMGPSGVFRLLRNKLRANFSDGTDDYNSLFKTMREASPVQKYVNAGRGDYLAVYCHAYQGMLMALVLLGLFLRMLRRRQDFLDVIAFNLCGGYLFHLIWEADNAYSIPFMLMLLMWAADAVEGVQGLLAARSPVGQTGSLASATARQEGSFAAQNSEGQAVAESGRPARAGRLVTTASALAAALCFAFAFLCVRRADTPVREYSVLQDQETSGSFLLQTTFSQTFRTGKPFDHLSLWVANWDGAANDSAYDVRILDEDGREAAIGEVIGAQAPCIDAYTIFFDRVEPEREQEYTIEISLRNPDCAIKTDFLYYGSGAWDMYPKGTLELPEETEVSESASALANMDLAFAVYQEE